MLIRNRLFLLWIGRDLWRHGFGFDLFLLPRPDKTPLGFELRSAFRFGLSWWFEPEEYWKRRCHRSVAWTGRVPGRWRLSQWRLA